MTEQDNPNEFHNTVLHQNGEILRELWPEGVSLVQILRFRSTRLRILNLRLALSVNRGFFPL